ESCGQVYRTRRPVGKRKERMGNGGSRNDPTRKTRYGCFLPDLTGFARAPSARLPGAIWRGGARDARSQVFVIARSGATKQAIRPRWLGLDCFATLAMTDLG